jgi:pyruvate/2-oxoacid:ferredoxin oxidoreductase beta subunit
MDCFEEGGYYPVIDKNVSPEGGDAALTIPGCRNTCYLKSYYYAGVEGGNQCRCSEYINGELAKRIRETAILPVLATKRHSVVGRASLMSSGPRLCLPLLLLPVLVLRQKLF